MNGYSKMKSIKTSKSRSIDLSDLLLSFPENPKLVEKSGPIHTSKTQETKQINTINSAHETPSEPKDEDDDGNGERFGVILSRNCSVSSTHASQRFRFDNQKQSTTTTAATTLQSAVKRAFSMRRSSSVSERYCRIHDQCVTLATPFDHDDVDDGGGGFYEGMDNNTMQTSSLKKKKTKNHRTGKILKACKRLFGL